MDPYADFLSRKAIVAPPSYSEIVAAKRIAFEPAGLSKIPALNSAMFPFQADVTDFLLRCGRGAAFLDTGLGKSLVSLEWGRVIVEHTNKPVLMLAPLAVSQQHEREAQKFGIDAKAIRDPREMSAKRVYVTNYERLEKFDIDAFGGIILDESSILKSFTGSTSRAIIAAFAKMPFRLAATATPAPNDHMELGQHSMFLGVMESSEMLSRWFIADQTEMGRYRLKKPAVRAFWEWVASWARAISKPSDLGYSDDGFVLPPLNIERHSVISDVTIAPGEEKDGQIRLFRQPDASATSIHREKRFSLDQRADAIAAAVEKKPGEPWLIWCETNDEADAVAERIPEAVEVRGSMKPEVKEERLVAFSAGQSRIMLTKPSIAGFGLNWQHCAEMAFVSLSYSYESYYQAVRRCWRFGQQRPVTAHIAMADTEAGTWAAIQRKATDHQTMKQEMCAAMARAVRTSKVMDDYLPKTNLKPQDWLRGRA
jgi:superfamily II DNA or RNA helicase